KLGAHRGGYDPFTFDITDALKKDGEQEVIVGVWDPSDAGTQPRGKQVKKPGGIYYTPTTGIWQTVWLEPVPTTRVESLHIIPNVDDGKVVICPKVRGKGEKTLVHVTVLDGDKAVGKATQAEDRPIEIAVPKAKLWSPETPFLYGLRVTVNEGDKPLDS